MIKHIITILVLSAAVVIGMKYTQQVVQLLLQGHDYIAHLLSDVFSEGQTGNILRDLLALLAIPFVVGLIPAIIYWIIRRTWLSCFMEIVWIVWLVQVGALAVSTQTFVA